MHKLKSDTYKNIWKSRKNSLAYLNVWLTPLVIDYIVIWMTLINNWLHIVIYISYWFMFISGIWRFYSQLFACFFVIKTIINRLRKNESLYTPCAQWITNCKWNEWEDGTWNFDGWCRICFGVDNWIDDIEGSSMLSIIDEWIDTIKMKNIFRFLLWCCDI